MPLVDTQVLDVGSGLGDNAIFLAEKDLKVTGIDFSPEALQEAKRRLQEAGKPAASNLSFIEGSALDLANVLGDREFSTALDCSLMHCFSPEDQKRYVTSLTPHVNPSVSLQVL